MLDGIFSHKAHDVPAGTRVSWDTKWKEFPGKGKGKGKGKPAAREFFGNCNGDMINKYYSRIFEVFGMQENSFVVLDNASTHKRFKQQHQIRDFTKDDLVSWLTERLNVNAFEYTPLTDASRVKVEQFVHKYNNYPGPDAVSRKDIMNFIRENKLRTVELMEAASWWGVGLWYLPPYWPELNAIEKLWARLKNDYRRTDPNKAWTERLEEAYAKIDALFIRKIISDTIRFARKKHAEFEANDVAAANVQIGQDDDDESVDENDSDDDVFGPDDGDSESEDSDDSDDE